MHKHGHILQAQLDLSYCKEPPPTRARAQAMQAADKLAYVIYEQAASPHLLSIVPTWTATGYMPHFICCLFFLSSFPRFVRFSGGMVIVEFVNTIYCYVC